MSQFKTSIDEAFMQRLKPEHVELIAKAKRKFEVKALKNDGAAMRISTRSRLSLMAAMLSAGVWLATPACAEHFFFSTGNPDGKLGAVSRPAGSQGLETETADDFVLTQATVVSGATMHGLIPNGTAVSGISRVEVEIYHIFPLDSDTVRRPNVPSRQNSPSDVEIAAATHDSSNGTLSFAATAVSPFTVQNTVVNGINGVTPLTHGEGPASGEEVEIDITFNVPIFLPAGHYFFRPEVQLSSGNFLFLSAPKPITSGTPFPAGFTDLQAWIRNSNLAPDWLRIGTDIIAGGNAFNMTYSLAGNTIPEAGTPGQASCHGHTIAAMAKEFGGIDASASALGYSSVDALQDGVTVFCKP
jgi:hypothetical protein